MTKKDYERIATALRYVKPTSPLGTPKHHKIVLESMSKQWVWTVEELAATLLQNNPRFNREKFYAACNK
jgi:hypothetical protein